MKKLATLPRWTLSFVVSFYWSSGITNDVPALAYYLVLSLAPLTLGLAAVSTLIFGVHLEAAGIAREVGHFLPPSSRNSITRLVASTEHDSWKLLALAVAAMLWTSSAAIGVIERCLARLTGARRYPMLRGRLRNILLGATLCSLLILAVAAASLAGGLTDYLPHGWNVFGVPVIVLNVAGMTLFCSLIFHYGVRDGVCWRAALTGAFPAALTLQFAPLLVGLYFHVFAHPVAASIFISFAVVLLGCFALAVGMLVGVGVCARVQAKHGSGSTT